MAPWKILLGASMGQGQDPSPQTQETVGMYCIFGKTWPMSRTFFGMA